MPPKCLRNLIVCFPVLLVVLVCPLFLELSEGLIVCFPILSICGGALIFSMLSMALRNHTICNVCFWPGHFPQLHSLGSLVSIFLAGEFFTLNIIWVVCFFSVCRLCDSSGVSSGYLLCFDNCLTAVTWLQQQNIQLLLNEWLPQSGKLQKSSCCQVTAEIWFHLRNSRERLQPVAENVVQMQSFIGESMNQPEA